MLQQTLFLSGNCVLSAAVCREGELLPLAALLREVLV